MKLVNTIKFLFLVTLILTVFTGAFVLISGGEIDLSFFRTEEFAALMEVWFVASFLFSAYYFLERGEK